MPFRGVRADGEDHFLVGIDPILIAKESALFVVLLEHSRSMFGMRVFGISGTVLLDLPVAGLRDRDDMVEFR